MLRPVCISSMWPLSVPVRSHCAANCFCERFAISIVTTTESGTSSSEIDGEQRADREHHDEHADDGEHRRDDLREALLQRVGDVVDVVGHAREDVAARVVVEVAQRQPRELLVDLVAQVVDDALRDADREVLLQPAEERAQQVDGREQHEQDCPMACEVHAHARRQVHAREHVGELRLPLRPQSRDRPAACVTPAGSCLPTTPSNSSFVALPRIFGPSDAERDAHDREHDDERDHQRCGRSRPSSRLPEPSKSLDLATGMPTHVAAARPAASRRPPRALPSVCVCFSLGHHAISSSVSCE